MKGKTNIILDWKVMGINRYVPIFASLLILIYVRTLIVDSLNIAPIITGLESVLPVFCGWWTIQLFSEILEEEGGETILSYPVERIKLGSYRVGIFTLFYMVLIAIVIFIIQIWLGEKIFTSLFLQISIEAIFFSSLSFFLEVVICNSLWTLGIIFVYTSTDILTKGSVLPILNVFLFNKNIIPLKEIIPSTMHIVFLSIVLWILAQVIFNRHKRF